MMLEQLSCLRRPGDAHAAPAEPQIQHLMAAALFLQDDVRSHDPDIRSPIFHISGNIRPLGQEKTEFLFLIGKNQLAGLFVLELFAEKACLFKKLHGLSGQTPLGKGDCQILHILFL